jgi:hypothetical protein
MTNQKGAEEGPGGSAATGDDPVVRLDRTRGRGL